MPARYENRCHTCRFICSHGDWDVWLCSESYYFAMNEACNAYFDFDFPAELDGLDDAYVAARGIVNAPDPSVSPNAT